MKRTRNGKRAKRKNGKKKNGRHCAVKALNYFLLPIEA